MIYLVLGLCRKSIFFSVFFHAKELHYLASYVSIRVDEGVHVSQVSLTLLWIIHRNSWEPGEWSTREIDSRTEHGSTH